MWLALVLCNSFLFKAYTAIKIITDQAAWFYFEGNTTLPSFFSAVFPFASRFSVIQTHTPAPAPGKWTGGELQDQTAAPGRIKSFTLNGLKQRQPEPEVSCSGEKTH